MTEPEKTGLARGLTITGDPDCTLDLRRSFARSMGHGEALLGAEEPHQPEKGRLEQEGGEGLVAEQRPWIAPACLASTLWMPLIQPAFSGSFGRSAASARNSSSVADQPGA